MEYSTLDYRCFPLKNVIKWHATCANRMPCYDETLEHIKKLMKTAKHDHIGPFSHSDVLIGHFNLEIIRNFFRTLNSKDAESLREIIQDSEEFGVLYPRSFYGSEWEGKDWYFAVGYIYSSPKIKFPKELGKTIDVEFSYDCG